jgi:hypothetical protein
MPDTHPISRASIGAASGFNGGVCIPAPSQPRWRRRIVHGDTGGGGDIMGFDHRGRRGGAGLWRNGGLFAGGLIAVIPLSGQ